MKLTLIILALVSLLSGCTATRTLSDVGLGAGGAVLAHQLSDGSSAATAAGAAGGVLLSEGLHYSASKQTQKAWVAGYDKGRSDAVKQQYWLKVEAQKPGTKARNLRLYPIQIPEQQIDGVTFKSRTQLLRLED